jgi:hypothetical protein
MAKLDLDAELAGLPAMATAELRSRWVSLTGTAAPKVLADTPRAFGDAVAHDQQQEAAGS